MRKTVFTLIAMLPCAAHAEYHSVSWFANHDPERRAMMAWCRDNAGLARHVPNCINATESETDVALRQLNAHLAAIRDQRGYDFHARH